MWGCLGCAGRLLLGGLLAGIALLWWFSDYPPRILPRRPDMIIVHHSATPPSAHGHPIDAVAIDAMHAQRGFRTLYNGRVYHVGYHYVILPDGTVQPGRPEGCVGAHARHVNGHALGICLIGNFSRAANPRGKEGPNHPSAAQMRALVRLCASLERKYGIPPEQVRRHRDVGQTECPGDQFPYARFQQALRHTVVAGQE